MVPQWLNTSHSVLKACKSYINWTRRKDMHLIR